MKLIDHICEITGDDKKHIIDLACPSNYGPEYDKYEMDCGEFERCKDCWEQEIKI